MAENHNPLESIVGYIGFATLVLSIQHLYVASNSSFIAFEILALSIVTLVLTGIS